MNIAVCGWHYGKGLAHLKAKGAYVVGHRPHELADVVIPNVGLEFHAYDHYLKNVWQGGPCVFTHDDNTFTDAALAAIEKIDADQAFLFGTSADAHNSGYAHGRAFVCSDRFLAQLKQDGGFWYDEGQTLNPETFKDKADHHNSGIWMFREYCRNVNHGMRACGCAVVEGLVTGFRDSGKVRLNLGCGQLSAIGYTNIDIAPGKGVDKVADIRKLDYADNSVDEILLYHVIEHFTYDDAIAMLKSYHRMLKPGGAIVIEAPDVFKAVKNRPNNQMEAIIGIFGDINEIRKGRGPMQHLWGWTSELMQSALKNIGFRIAKAGDGRSHDRPWRDFRVVAVKE